jgi:hypothetical protein
MTRPASDEDNPLVSAANRQRRGGRRTEDDGREGGSAEK